MAELESRGAALDVATHAGALVGVPVLLWIRHTLCLILRVDAHALALVPMVGVLAGVTVALLHATLTRAGLVVLHLNRLLDRVLGVLGSNGQTLQDARHLTDRDSRREALKQV